MPAAGGPRNRSSAGGTAPHSGVVAARRAVVVEETELCGFCLGGYVYEMERRCVACDRPVCPVCVITLRRSREAWCPECRGEAREPAGEEGG